MTLPVYEGNYCAGCGLKESRDAWFASTVAGCPECGAAWPDKLVKRHPDDGGPPMREYERPAEPPPHVYTFTSPYRPKDGAFLVLKQDTVTAEETCAVCDGTGQIGVHAQVSCPGPRGRHCVKGKLRSVEPRWVVLPCEIRVIEATIVLRSESGALGSANAPRVTLSVWYKGGIDRSDWTVLKIPQGHGRRVDIYGDEPVLCETLGKATCISVIRNEVDEAQS